MDLLLRWLEAIALVAGLVALGLGFVAVALNTPAHVDARRRNRAGDRW